MDSKITVTFDHAILKVVLAGKLDAFNAPQLQEDLKQYIGQPINKIIYFATELEYISSAGLRVMIFSKQKLGIEAQVYLIGASGMVQEVVKMSGLDNFMTIQDTYQD